MIRCDKPVSNYQRLETISVPSQIIWLILSQKESCFIDAKLKKSLTRKSIQRGSEGPPKDNRKQIIRMLGKSCNNKNVLHTLLSWDHY